MILYHILHHNSSVVLLAGGSEHVGGRNITKKDEKETEKRLSRLFDAGQ